MKRPNKPVALSRSANGVRAPSDDLGSDDDRVQLLFGPYKAPPLQRGNRSFCLFRDCLVVVTCWTDARISWPRCRALDGPGGGSGLLVDEELARAVRHESALALRYWWGASSTAVWHWRTALGVRRADPEGSRRLIQAAAEKGAAELRGKPLPPEQVEQRRRNALRNNNAQYLRPGYQGPWWTAEELALLGTLPDEVVAALVGRTMGAVRCQRTLRGLPSACDRRRKRT
jgi:hypothetical protein